jgi:vesicle-fusing ATPase
LRQAQRYVEQARTTEHMRVITVLMHGPSESGKTALAASIGINADYPYVRLVSPRSLAGMSELGKVQYIKDAFDDAYKSPLSLVIVDDIERIIGMCPVHL